MKEENNETGNYGAIENLYTEKKSCKTVNGNLVPIYLP